MLALTEYAPDAADRMHFSTMTLTPEQLAELLNVARAYCQRRPILAQYCTPLNAPWIFTAIDSVIRDIEAVDAIPVEDRATIYPFMLAQELEYAYLVTPATLRQALKTRINAIYDTMPDVFRAVQWAIMTAGSLQHLDIWSVKAEAMRESALLDDAPQAPAV